MQGEFLGGGPPVTRTRRVKNPREAAAYTFGYNHSLFAQRVHDAVTALAFLESERANPDSLLRPIRSINLVGLGEAGPWAVAARALGGAVVRRAVIDTGGFRFGAVADLGDPAFLPGGAKYFDLPGMIALGAPGALLLAGEGATPQQLDAVIRTAYGAAPARLELVESADGAVLAGRAARWLAEGGE